MRRQNKFIKFINSIKNGTWVFISFLLALLLWQLISMSEMGGLIFASPKNVILSMINMAKDGRLFINVGDSLGRVLKGFFLAFIFAVPIAILMGWYKIICNLFEPWIQFVRNIPPIAYIPLIVVAFGVREKSKVAIIFIAAFLTMVITIYQGVRNVDPTLIKAAKILGASDGQIFFKIVVPASLPFVFTAVYLGLGASLTALVASEMAGAQTGLGTMIQEASQFFQMDVVLMGILLIGIIGMILLKIVKLLEKYLTRWQDLRG